jgi:glutamate-5-semialdehyde dehydrogenase
VSVRQLAERARHAGAGLAALDGGARSALLRDVAGALGDPTQRARLLAANAEDRSRAEGEAARGELSPALLPRLALDGEKLDGLADGLRQLAGKPELVNQVTLRRELDDGLVLTRVTSPLGLVGVVFESRPDAVLQICGLAIKSGNAVLLKGGREATCSNRALVALLHESLERHGVDPAAIGLLADRAEFADMLALDDLVDVVVARGSTAFVVHTREHTRIPVMGHAEGLCHLYLHRAAEPAMAARIAVDAKCGYPAACNSIETLLWDEGAEAALDAAVAALRAAGVELRACAATLQRHPELGAASEDDWDREYGALALALRRVAGLDAALAHIAAHGSRHTEAIVTADAAAARRFLAAVDAAGVFHNASTRFADGYRYGLGAEVGISTGKLHARGPVGIEGLLTYRWLLQGEGQVAGDYGPGGRRFSHRDLLP